MVKKKTINGLKKWKHAALKVAVYCIPYLVLFQQHLHSLKIVAMFLRHCQGHPLLNPELRKKKKMTMKRENSGGWFLFITLQISDIHSV